MNWKIHEARVGGIINSYKIWYEKPKGFFYGSENWTLTTTQRRRTETAEIKLLRPLAGYTLF